MTHFTFLLHATLAVVIITSILCSSGSAPIYVNSANVFNRCANFSIQAGTSVTFSGGQTNLISGSVGVSPGMSIIGVPLQAAGYALQANSAAAISCTTDQKIAYFFLAGAKCNHLLGSAELSGLTLLPGVYCIAAALTLTDTPLYFDAQSDSNAQWIIQMGTTLITSSNTQIILLNGALAKNIFWQVGSAATLGISSTFIGNVVAGTAITVGGSANVLGRLYAQAAVSFTGAAKVTLPSLY